jgi:ferredoxin
MPVVTFYHQHRSFEVDAGTNLRQLMMRVNVPPYSGLDRILNCRGNNLCGTCAVEIVGGKGASPRGQDEEATLVGNLLLAHQVDKNIRLSCQTTVAGDMVVKTYPSLPLDKEKTKERVGLFAIVSFFLIIFAGVFAVMLFDMIKLF